MVSWLSFWHYVLKTPPRVLSSPLHSSLERVSGCPQFHIHSILLFIVTKYTIDNLNWLFSQVWYLTEGVLIAFFTGLVYDRQIFLLKQYAEGGAYRFCFQGFQIIDSSRMCQQAIFHRNEVNDSYWTPPYLCQFDIEQTSEQFGLKLDSFLYEYFYPILIDGGSSSFRKLFIFGEVFKASKSTTSNPTWLM